MNKVGFIGAGNMASSLVGGMLNAGFDPGQIRAADPSPATQIQQYGIQLMPDNLAITDWADIIVLAVKPQIMREVCQQIASRVGPSQLIISIAAGIRSTSIVHWLATDIACIRVMPNTPALVGLGMSGVYANPQTSQQQLDSAIDILSTVGEVVQLDNENKLDAVTAVSGSGPAYFFLLMEAMIEAATRQGLSDESARLLVTQTAQGAANMAGNADVDIAELRRRVTSPGGTTEQAINTFLQGNFMQLVNDAIDAAARRSMQMSDELGEADHE